MCFFFHLSFKKKKLAPNFLDLATTLENLGARGLLEKKVNFVPCSKIMGGLEDSVMAGRA